MENAIRLDNTSLNFNNSLSKSHISSQDIDSNYNYYWENSKSSEISCSDSILKQNDGLERFLNSKRANFISNLKLNNKNKNSKRTGFEVNSIKNDICNHYADNVSKRNFISVRGIAFSEKLALMKNKQKKGIEASILAHSVKNKSNGYKEIKLNYNRRYLSHDDFLVKNNKSTINYESQNKIFDIIYAYFYNIKNDSNNKSKHSKWPKNLCKSFEFGNKIFIRESSNRTDITRKISNVLYNLIANNENFSEREALNDQQNNNNFSNKQKNKTKSKFGSIEKLTNLINSEKKAINAGNNVIGPTPNIKEIKKNFAFNKSFDSLDVQSEFFISYLRDEDLVSEEMSESIKNTESNKAEGENENEYEDNDNFNKSNDQDAKENYNFRYINNNQANNYLKNKNYQEKVLVNINNNYSKNLHNNKTSKHKNLNFNNLENNNNMQNKKLETVESSNYDNNSNNKENQKCCFFKCKSNTNNNLNVNSNNLNAKNKKGKKQDANINSYYSTVNNTKRSTNHSFKSIRLNDSLTKFRKRRLSNCTTDRDSKCLTKGSNSNLANLINVSNPNKKDKKVDCRCEIF